MGTWWGDAVGVAEVVELVVGEEADGLGAEGVGGRCYERFFFFALEAIDLW